MIFVVTLETETYLLYYNTRFINLIIGMHKYVYNDHHKLICHAHIITELQCSATHGRLSSLNDE